MTLGRDKVLVKLSPNVRSGSVMNVFALIRLVRNLKGHLIIYLQVQPGYGTPKHDKTPRMVVLNDMIYTTPANYAKFCSCEITRILHHQPNKYSLRNKHLVFLL